MPVSLFLASILFTGLSLPDEVFAQPSDSTNNVDIVDDPDDSADEPVDVNDNSMQEEQDSTSSQDSAEEDGTSDTPLETTSSSPDFTDLRQFLELKNWEEADKETFKILLSIVGPTSQDQGRFELDEWQAFIENEENCTMVRNLDALWSFSSNSQLGFSAQRRVFQNSDQNFLDFYKRVKWLTEGADAWLVSWNYADGEAIYVEKPNFKDAASIEGHLPALMEWEVASGEEQAQDRRFEMINSCNL